MRRLGVSSERRRSSCSSSIYCIHTNEFSLSWNTERSREISRQTFWKKKFPWRNDFRSILALCARVAVGAMMPGCGCCSHFSLEPVLPSAAIWPQSFRSTLARVMACCLTAPSHYLNQCWLIISEILLKANSPEMFNISINGMSLKMINLKIAPKYAPWCHVNMRLQPITLLWKWPWRYTFCTTCHDDVIKWKPFPRYWPYVRGIHRSSVNSLQKGLVTRSFDVFFDLCLNKRLSKQSWGWWFETPSRSSWRHRNALENVTFPHLIVLKMPTVVGNNLPVFLST